MNKDIVKGKWNEVKGKLKQQWSKFTDDDVTEISGKYDELLGKLQSHYGFERERAEQEIDKFIKANKWTS